MKTRVLILVFCVLILIAALSVSFILIRDMQTQTRGVTFGAPNNPQFGVNASLEQYSDANLDRALKMICASGATIVRQHFYWSEIEPRKGEFAWDQWDRIIARANENSLRVIAVIDTTPDWARDPGEADLVNAPPAKPDDYARFVAAFVNRYGDRVPYIQVWDNPNVHPFWGRRNADPFEYTALLRAGARAARAANPQVKILAAGLGPNGESIREHPDFSDILFLRGMYDAGAKDYFDIAAAKPYGMWTGPDDRRVAPDVFNFSRAILLRDEMLAHGDANKPMWAVEFGWNTLPQDWRGIPSAWGTDTEPVQSVRLASAIRRAKSEWAWMPGLIVQSFQPNVPSDDPQWGFALVDQNLQARAFYTALKDAIAAPAQPSPFDFTRFYVVIAALVLVAFGALVGTIVTARQIPWLNGWSEIERQFARLPELVQFALLAACALALYYSPNVALNFGLFALLGFLFALRPDLGLAITVFAIPFYLFPKNLISGMQFSMVELLMLASVASFMLRAAGRKSQTASRQWPVTDRALHFAFGTWNLRLATCDLTVIFFVLLGLLSIKTAGNFGVASREFRVIVIEPALLYALIRFGDLTRRDLWRLVDAFLASALVVSLIGLYQFFFTNWVIVGEGVRRVLAVYGSPNHLALFIDRALPLLIALALFIEGDKKRRIVYALVAMPIALALYLTYSRGSLVFALPAALLVLGLFSGKRVRPAIVALAVIGVIAMIPFAQTERFQSLFQTGTGTGFFRWSVWQSGIAMIRDHPIFGVGLDNFLYEYPKYIQPDAWREPNLSHPHNIVLDFWVRLGVMGVVVLGWFLIEFYRAGLGKLASKNRVLVIGLMASMTAALAHGLIDAAYFYVDLAFVFMLTLGVMIKLDDSVIG